MLRMWLMMLLKTKNLDKTNKGGEHHIQCHPSKKEKPGLMFFVTEEFIMTKNVPCQQSMVANR